MQVKKERIKRNILISARKEFGKNMFQNASMHKIADDSGITTSNIYNYFENKDDIFKAILTPVINIIDSGLNTASILMSKELQNNHDINQYKENISKIFKFIDNNRNDLELLFLKSKGSSLENFREEIVQKYTEIFDDQFKLVKNQYPDIKNISKFLWLNLLIFASNIILEILKNKITLAEMKNFNEELCHFLFYGFGDLFDSINS
jgi:TetR/AcrR family transcriptional regulator, cholesterol catabolism regulator